MLFITTLLDGGFFTTLDWGVAVDEGAALFATLLGGGIITRTKEIIPMNTNAYCIPLNKLTDQVKNDSLSYLLIITGSSLLQKRECYTHVHLYIVHVKFQNWHEWIIEYSMCSHLPGFPLKISVGISFLCLHTTAQDKYKNQYPHGSSNLISTINLTLTSFYTLILFINRTWISKTCPTLLFVHVAMASVTQM